MALLARGREGLERTAEEVRSSGRRALVLPADVSDRAAVGGAVQKIERELGGLDVLVLNAAVSIFGPFRSVTAEEFDRTVEVSFLGAVNTVRATLPLLERSRGAIVATGSINSKMPLPNFSSYCAAKHALRGFLGTLRIELRAQRVPVTVSMLHPGAINTPVWERTATATGQLPRRPPEAYTPQTIARALVGLALDPRPEVTVGAEAKALEGLFLASRSAGDLVLTMVHHYYASGGRPANEVSALWHAVGRGIADNGLLGRRSLTLPARLAMWPARRTMRTLLRR
ncbi:MAG: SDR family NAD(P)-dependent oxidoreductase [Actinomycetota bacterium]|nr:SDR family NAD(P)-dependent oxidoreductase [Actinomycetota bacterium]